MYYTSNVNVMYGVLDLYFQITAYAPIFLHNHSFSFDLDLCKCNMWSNELTNIM